MNSTDMNSTDMNSTDMNSTDMHLELRRRGHDEVRIMM